MDLWWNQMPVRSMARRVGAPVVALVAAVASVAACGGDPGPAASSTAPTSTASPSTAPTATGSAAVGSAATAPVATRATVIAHRGASATAPEHTFAAYDLAVAQGAEYIEQDLQMTADGVLVVLHDSTLDRTARGPAGSCTGPVASRTIAQLRECEVGSWFNDAAPDRADPAYEGLAIPTLEAVFDRYGDDVRYYIETKAPEARPGMEQALLDLVQANGLADRVLVQSFSAESLRLVHARRPDLPLVQLRRDTDPPLDAAALDGIAAYAVGIGPATTLVDATLVRVAHDRCLAVHPYTVDDAAEMGRLLDLGVDGLFTNRPDVLVVERARHPDPPTPPARCVDRRLPRG